MRGSDGPTPGRADFNRLTADANQVIYVFDAVRHGLTYLSPSFESVWGEPRYRILADLSRWAELLHPDDREFEVEFRQAIHDAAVEPVVGGYRIIRPDGQMREIRDTAIPLRDAEGKLTHVVGLARDLTAEDIAQPDARAGQAAWLALVDHAPFGVGLFSPAGVCLRINPALERLNGRPEAEHLGKVIWDLAPGLRDAVKPIFEQMRIDGRPVLNVEISGRPAHLAGALRRSRCSYIPVLRDSQLDAVIALIHDVTEERLEQEAAASLREREARARLALRAGGLVPWQMDPATGQIVADEQLMELFGMQGDMPASADPFIERIHPDDRERTLQELRKAEVPGGTYHARFRVLHPGKGIRWLVGTAEGVIAADGRVRIVGYNGNVTQEVEAEQERVLLADELLHRTKNLLTMIRSIASLTGQNATDMRSFLYTFDERIMAIARSFGRLHGGSWRGVALDELVHEALSHFGEGRIRSDGPRVSVAAETSQRLSLVLHELATNALKHGSLSVAGGHVELRWSVHDDDRLEIDWSEHDGPAIAAKSEGFGSKLITRLTSPLGAYCLSPAGVRWRDVIELERSRDQTAQD